MNSNGFFICLHTDWMIIWSEWYHESSRLFVLFSVLYIHTIFFLCTTIKPIEKSHCIVFQWSVRLIPSTAPYCKHTENTQWLNGSMGSRIRKDASISSGKYVRIVIFPLLSTANCIVKYGWLHSSADLLIF